MKRVFLICLAVVLSCMTAVGQSKKTHVDYKESSARTLEAEHQFFSMPLIADLTVVGDRIVHVEKSAFADYIVDENVLKYIEDFKKLALGKAVQAYKADALLGTVFEVETEADGHLRITVTGYPAVYSNFRNATRDELDLITKAEIVNDSRKNEEAIKSPDQIVDVKK